MIGLITLTIIAVLAAAALRRVRDRILAGLALGGLVLIAIPAVLVEGDAAERLIAAIYAYAPYWEYLIPLAFFTLALLPTGKNKSKKRKKEKSTIVTV